MKYAKWLLLPFLAFYLLGCGVIEGFRMCGQVIREMRR